MSYHHGPRIVTDGLVLYLDAGNSKSYPGSGTTWFDLSGNNNGILINNPTFLNSNKGFVRTDGINDHIALTNNDGLGNIFSSCSIDLTIRTRTGAGTDNIGYILHRSTTTTVGASVYAIYMQATSLVFSINGINNIITLTDRNNILANYCYIWDGSVVSLYVNGIFNSSINFTTFTNTRVGSVTTIGGTSLNTTYRPGNCDFSNIKIYNKALNQNEILQNYNALKGRFSL
jgi:hypothetical protein